MAVMPLDLEALIKVPSLLGFDYAPDGQSVAYASNVSGLWEIYLRDLKMGTTNEPKRITDGPERKTAPQFSPDSRYIAYMQDFQGNENFDIFIYDSQTEKTVNLTHSPNIAIYPGVSWSPDGQHIAFVSNQDGTFATYTIELQTGKITRVSHHSYSDGEVEFSPDGKFLAVGAQTEGLDGGLFVINLADGSEREVKLDGIRIDAGNPHWSPDSRFVAFESNTHGSYHLGLWDNRDGSLRWLTEGDWDTTQPRFSPDGARLAFVINRDANVELGLLDLAENIAAHYRVAGGIHSGPRWSPNGQTLLFRYVGPRYPADLWRLDLQSGQTEQITHSLSQNTWQEALVEPRTVRYSSRKDQASVPALLYLPQEQQKGAAVVYIHGGPTAQQQNGWAADIQYLVNRGLVVICPNYRGSTGYGKIWQEANIYNMGMGDLADVMGAVDYLVEQKLAQPSKIAVTGGSYGGYMTMLAITRFPQEWAAAVSIVPFLNWFTEYENEREDLKYYDSQMMGDPVKDYQRWFEVSPINFLQNIQTPVLLLAGAHDPRCPAEETQQAIDKLAELGKTYEAHIYPDEGHGFSRIENRINAVSRQVEFLERYLGGLK